MEVFPAFALPMMSTLNWIFEALEGCELEDAKDSTGDGGDGTGAGTGVGASAGAGAGDRAGDAGAGDGGDGAGTDTDADADAGIGARAGARAGDSAGAGAGGGDGTRQQILCFAPIARKCCEKKDWATCVDHSSESGSSYTQSTEIIS